MISFKIIFSLSIILMQGFSGISSQYFYDEPTNLDIYSLTEFHVLQNNTSEIILNPDDNTLAKKELSESIHEFNNNFTASNFSVEKNSSENDTLVRNTESADIFSTISTTTLINEISGKDISENKDKLIQDYISSTTTSLDFNDQKQFFTSSNTEQTTTKNSALTNAKSIESTSRIPKIITSVMVESRTEATKIESSTKISKSYILAYFNSTEGLKISFKQMIILVFFSIVVCSN